MMTDFLPEFEAILAGYLRALTGFDFAAAAAYWDKKEPQPLYIAEEHDSPMTTHEAIADYWAATARAQAWMTGIPSGLAAVPRGNDLWRLVFHLDWASAAHAVDGTAPAVGGSVRVAVLLRRIDAGWRMVEWIEAPMAPLPFLRKVYRTAGAAIARRETGL